MDGYDLFSAMSGVDEELVARSDHRAKRRNSGWILLLAVAACFALFLFGVRLLFKAPEPESLYIPPTTATSETEGTVPATIDPNRPLQLKGSDVGTLNILQLSHVEETASMPDFLMYINQNDYQIAESGGAFHIYPTSGAAANRMTLNWQASTTVEDAARQQIAALTTTAGTVSEPAFDPLLGGLMICGKQLEVYIADDLQGGVFIFTLKFESNDHAIRFRDMMQTFEIVRPNRETPAWMIDLRNAVESFTSAFLKNDFSGTEDLLSENAEVYTYEADVRSETCILQTHYQVDNDTAPTAAHVSVRHKYREPDAYDYITIELEYVDGKWQVNWAMIER